MRLLILIIVLLLIISIYFASVVKSFKIKFDGLTNVIISGVDINSLISNQTIITSRVKLIITFSSFFSISISNLNVKVYKNKLLIAESTKGINENEKKITLAPNVENSVYQTFDLHFNYETLDLALKEKSKQNYTLSYVTSFKLFGFPVTKNGTFEKVNKKQSI